MFQISHRIILACIIVFCHSICSATNQDSVAKPEQKNPSAVEQKANTEVSSLVDKGRSKKIEELTDKELELKRLEVENALNRALLEYKMTQELAGDKVEIERLKIVKELMSLNYEIEGEQNRRKHVEKILGFNNQKELLQAELEVYKLKTQQELQEFNKENMVIEKELYRNALETELIRGNIESQKNRKEVAKFVITEKPLIHTEAPFQKNIKKLVISDRKINLNGLITPWKANYIEKGLSFYNNKSSKYPIFLVIESSPGGSVIAGQRILQAIKSSAAPVYVVLKGFAASMSAVILTLADNSFAYPNAIILHHLPSFSGFGSRNVREIKEEARRLEEIFKRLMGPIAKKMRISLEELDRKFYEKSVHGDWMEYADDAVKLKWVNEIVETVEDSSTDYMPAPEDDTLRTYLEDYYRYGFETSNRKEDSLNNKNAIPSYDMNFDYDYSYHSESVKK